MTALFVYLYLSFLICFPTHCFIISPKPFYKDLYG